MFGVVSGFGTRVGGNGTGVCVFARAANSSEKAQRGKFVSDGEKRNETERNDLINEQTYWLSCGRRIE